MSSSNIIKQREVPGAVIAPFRFGPVQEAALLTDETAVSGFVPFLEAMFDSTPENPREEYADADGTPEEGHIETTLPEIAGIPEEVHHLQVQEAYEKGLEEGKRLAERGLGNVFKALREAVEEIAGLRAQVLHEAEEDLLTLAIMVARKVIHQEIATDRLILAKVVAAAVNSVSERDEVVIRLNPEDQRLVSAHRQLYLNGLSDDRMLELKADDTVSAGGCIVDPIMGEIDARTETQLNEIFRCLLEERNHQMSLPDRHASERETYAYEEN